MANDAVAAGDFWLWDLDGPVAMAALSRAVGRVTRIRSVYTPPSERALRSLQALSMSPIGEEEEAAQAAPQRRGSSSPFSIRAR